MGAGVNKVATVAMVSVVLLGTSALGYGVARATSDLGAADRATPAGRASTSQVQAPTDPGTSEAGRPPGGRAPDRRRVRRQVSAPLPAVRPRAIPEPGPQILGPGDKGAKVRELQSRLRQIAWYYGNVTDDYGSSTTAAVKGFQEKRQIAVTGYVDQRTLNRLHAHDPDADRRRARQQAARQHLDGRTAGPPLQDRPGAVRGQVEQHGPLGRRRQGAADDGGALRRRRTPRPGRGCSTWAGSRATTSRSCTTPRCRSRCSSPAGRRCTTPRTSPPAGYSGASHGCVNVRDLAGISGSSTRWPSATRSSSTGPEGASVARIGPGTAKRRPP